MHKDFPKIATTLSGDIRDLRAAAPEVMKAFSGLAQSATTSATLDHKTKELIALAIGVALRCDGCIAFHAKALVAAGATREEVAEVLGVNVYMGGGPSMVYSAQALEAFDQFVEQANKG